MNEVQRGNHPALQAAPASGLSCTDRLTAAWSILGVQVEVERMAVWAKACGGGEGSIPPQVCHVPSPQVEAAAGNPGGAGREEGELTPRAVVLDFETLYIFFKSVIMWYTPH